MDKKRKNKSWGGYLGKKTGFRDNMSLSSSVTVSSLLTYFSTYSLHRSTSTGSSTASWSVSSNSIVNLHSFLNCEWTEHINRKNFYGAHLNICYRSFKQLPHINRSLRPCYSHPTFINLYFMHIIVNVRKLVYLRQFSEVYRYLLIY